MHPSSYLLVAVAVFAVPTRAVTTLDLNQAAARSQALYALNVMQAPGMEFGRFFDAAGVAAARLTERAIPPQKAELPPRAPFALQIPRTPPPSFQRSFARLLKAPRTDGYDRVIRDQAREQGLDPRLVKSVIAAESEFTRRAKSPAGALGLMQVKPDTAEEMGVQRRSLFDPVENIRAGTRYLAYLFARAWERYHLKGVPYAKAPEWLVQRVIAAYNAGPRWVARRRMYAQTRDYVKRVLLFYRSKVSELRAAA